MDNMLGGLKERFLGKKPSVDVTPTPVPSGKKIGRRAFLVGGATTVATGVVAASTHPQETGMLLQAAGDKLGKLMSPSSSVVEAAENIDTSGLIRDEAIVDALKNPSWRATQQQERSAQAMKLYDSEAPTYRKICGPNMKVKDSDIVVGQGFQSIVFGVVFNDQPKGRQDAENGYYDQMVDESFRDVNELMQHFTGVPIEEHKFKDLDPQGRSFVVADRGYYEYTSFEEYMTEIRRKTEHVLDKVRQQGKIPILTYLNMRDRKNSVRETIDTLNKKISYAGWNRGNSGEATYDGPAWPSYGREFRAKHLLHELKHGAVRAPHIEDTSAPTSAHLTDIMRSVPSVNTPTLHREILRGICLEGDADPVETNYGPLPPPPPGINRLIHIPSVPEKMRP